MVRFAEGLCVVLDQPLVIVDAEKALAQRRPVDGAGFGDRQGRELHRIVGVGDADRRADIAGTFDIRVLRHQRSQHLFADLVLLPEEAVGLHEMHLAGPRAREFGEAAAGNPPM